MKKFTPFEELLNADPVIDAVYEAEAGGQLTGEAVSKLMLGIGNIGGFRAAGVDKVQKFVVLYSSGRTRIGPTYSMLPPVNLTITVTTKCRATSCTTRSGGGQS
jgi:hypothetical protein